MTSKTSSSGLVPTPVPQQPFNPPTKNDWDRLFQTMFDEYFNLPSSVVSLVLVVAAPRVVDIVGSPSSITIDQDAPSSKFENKPIVTEPTVKKPVVETSETKANTDKPKVVRNNCGPLIIEDWISDSKDEDESRPKIKKKTIKPSFSKIKFVKSKEQVKSSKKIAVRQGVNTPQSDDDRLKHIELMKICTILPNKVPDLEEELKRIKTKPQTKIDGLKRSVKKLENKYMSRTHNLTRSYKVGLIATEEVVEVVTTAKMIIDVVVDVAQVTIAIADFPVSAAETIVTTSPTITAESTKTNDKGKGKAKMIEEPEMPKKRKHQIIADEELAEQLQDNIDEENRIAREKAQEVEEKMEDDKESAELKKYLEIVPDDGDDVTINATPLSSKSPTIVDYNKLLKNFDREDLKVLWRLVKAKHGSTRPKDGYERVLWGDLKVMFDPHVEDEVWKLQQSYKVLRWTLFNCCRVHCLSL
nr:hypothetical protein [Tanacetum cinerariifolium]